MEEQTMSNLDRTEKTSLAKIPEPTRPGPIYTPAVDIFESDDLITLLADMPGVRAQDLTIDLRDNVLTLTARSRVAEQARESSLLSEFVAGTYYRQFTLADTIDQARIDAKLHDGVLRLELPKAERAKPRKITVRAA